MKSDVHRRCEEQRQISDCLASSCISHPPAFDEEKGMSDRPTYCMWLGTSKPTVKGLDYTPSAPIWSKDTELSLLWICVESTDRLSGNRIQLGIVDFCSSSKALWHWCVLEFKSWVGLASFLGFTGFGPSTQRPSGWWVLLGVCLGFARLVILQLMKIGSLLYKWATQLKLKFRIAVKMNFLCYNRGTHHSMCVQKHKA
jgi:hypothetical protein